MAFHALKNLGAGSKGNSSTELISAQLVFDASIWEGF